MAVARSGAGFVACLVAAIGCGRFGYDPIEVSARISIADGDADVGEAGGQSGVGTPPDDSGSRLPETSEFDAFLPPDVLTEDGSSGPDATSDAGPPPPG